MAAKQLPEEVLRDLALLLEHFDKLKAIVDFPTCVGGLYGLGGRIAADLELESDVVREIVFSLWKIKQTTEGRGEEPLETIAWLTSRIEERAPPEWQEKYFAEWNAHSPALADLIGAIGDDHPITIAIKAQVLAYSHQNIFLSGRLITDVRPVFNDAATEIDELVVTHMLSIEYTDGTQDKTVLTLALDQKDVMQLQAQCERAAQKVLTLKEGFKGFHLVVMPDIEEDMR